MNYRLSAALVAATVLLAGCASSTYRAPVEDRNGRPPVSESAQPATGVVVRPVESVPLQTRPLSTSPLPESAPQVSPQPTWTPEPAPRASHSSRNPAVVALLTNAQKQTRGGSLNAAQASLERAQRIAPRDPEVYYQLADLQRRKGDYRQAEQMALRGLEVAIGQPSMQRSLWALISSVRKSAGDMSGYRQALEKARQY